MGALLQDLRYGTRMLLKHPGFTLIAILTLAVGIGANSAIFSVVNSVLLRPLPFKEPERIVKVWETFHPRGQGTVSVANLKDWREQNDVFEHIAAYFSGNYSLQGREHPERIPGVSVTPDFFEVMGVQPALGRVFRDDETEAGNTRLVVISDRLWQRNFGSDPNIVGKDIPLGGESFTVTGVMPSNFRFPSQTTDLWVPLVFTPEQQANRGSHAYMAIARLKPGVTLAQAQEQMTTIAARIEQQYPDMQSGRSVLVIDLQEEVVGYMRQSLFMLLGAVGFVLLIACTNVANLLLARATGRRKEIAIRTALGAGRGRLIRQLLTESVLLSVTGGLLGLLLGRWGTDGLVALATGYLPRAQEVSLDSRVIIFTLTISLLTGILAGLAPAVQVSKTNLQESLKEGGRSGESPHRNIVRSLLVVGQTASALVLLIGAGLLIKSFMQLQRVDSGLRPENTLTMRITLPASKYNTGQSVSGFYDQLLPRVSGLPGVVSAGVITLLPVQQYGTNGSIIIEGQGPYPPGQAPLAEFRVTSSDYFATFKIPLVAGRFYNAQDQPNTEPVILINQTLARRYMEGEDPIGKRIRIGGQSRTVIGMVGDVKQSGLTGPARPEIYVPYTQGLSPDWMRDMTLVVRATSDPTLLTNAVRDEVLGVDPAQPIYNVKTMEQVISDSFSYQRLNTLLLSIFAGVALLLAVIGIYSVMSYTVTQNTREIGLRMALGAQQKDVLKLIVGQGLMLTLIGVGVGLAASFALTHLMASLLFGVTATDPLTFAAVSLLLIIVAVLACFIPARRATRVDPMVALRYE
ncbi:MAG TPA: ABC transporter permease [Blastocatellia bacterium]|nr:ABC transporter permease [Blastocatellia bacterium]